MTTNKNSRVARQALKYIHALLKWIWRAGEAERLAEERPANMAGAVPDEVHEAGWQWRPTGVDAAFAPPFGTIHQCRCCGCLVAGGPTACVRCVEAEAVRQTQYRSEETND